MFIREKDENGVGLVRPIELKSKEPVVEHENDLGIVAILDTETTGLSVLVDEIIEIGICLAYFNRKTGELYKVFDAYQEYNQPTKKISRAAQKVNKIDTEALQGKTINWDRVNTMLTKSDYVVAHNAAFDCPFIHKYLNQKQTNWVCSLTEIPWKDLGYISGSLEVLSLQNSFNYEGHRALNDVKALYHLLTIEHEEGKSYFSMLNTSFNTDKFIINTIGDTRDIKDPLKGLRFRWDPQNYSWWKMAGNSALLEELKEDIREMGITDFSQFNITKMNRLGIYV